MVRGPSVLRDFHVDLGVFLSRINVSIRPIKCLDGNIINWRPQTQVRHRVVSGDPGAWSVVTCVSALYGPCGGGGGPP